jgi:hypothetical protein
MSKFIETIAGGILNADHIVSIDNVVNGRRTARLINGETAEVWVSVADRLTRIILPAAPGTVALCCDLDGASLRQPVLGWKSIKNGLRYLPVLADNRWEFVGVIMPDGEVLDTDGNELFDDEVAFCEQFGAKPRRHEAMRAAKQAELEATIKGAGLGLNPN